VTVRLATPGSLSTFRIGSLLSSIITLGCASERALLNQIDAYGRAQPRPKRDPFKKKTDGKTIKVQFGELTTMVEGRLKVACRETSRAREDSVRQNEIDFEASRQNRFVLGGARGYLI
jgi:hypothetical protein